MMFVWYSFLLKFVPWSPSEILKNISPGRLYNTPYSVSRVGRVTIT